MRRRGKILKLIIFMLLAIIAQSSLWVSAASNGNIKIKVEAGFNGSFKYGCDVPINMIIENKQKDINGEVQIYAINGEGRSIIYAKSLSLPKNSTKDITLNVPVMNASTKLKIVILDGKNKMYEEEISIQSSGVSEQTVLIGILSDDFDSVSYINRVAMMGNSTLPSKTIKVSEKNFPEEFSVIKAFDVLVLNNFDTSKLNKNKYENLKKWVSNGGVLIIGTGATYSKTLAVFNDKFIAGEIGDIGKISTKELSKLVNSGKNINEINGMELNVLNIDIKDSQKLCKEGSTTLIQKLAKGKGGVLVTSFDLGLNPVSTWDQNTLLGEKLIGFSSIDVFAIQKGYHGDMYSINEAVSCNSDLPVPKTTALVVIIILYIVLAGPVSYIILKKLDKRGFMWATVPALSIIFAAIMYISGYGTRMSEPVANIVSIVNVDEKGYMTKSTYGGVFTPKKGDLKVQGEAGARIIPYANEMFQYRGNNSSDSKQVDAKVIMDAKSYIQYYEASAFSNKLLSIDEEQGKTGKLEIAIKFSNNRFSGTIKNDTGYDLENCNLINGTSYLTIDSIKNGENKSINDNSKSLNMSQGGVWEILDPMMRNGNSYYGPGVNMTESKRKEMLEARQKSAMVRVFMNNRSRMINAPMFIGWSKTASSKLIYVNDEKVKTYERSLIMAPINLILKDGNKVEYPFGYIQPVVTNSIGMIKFDNYSNKVYGQGTVEITYRIDENVKAEKVEVAINGYGSSSHKLAIWNNETNKWEEGNYNGFAKEGANYVDNNNCIRYRLERITDSSPTDLPQISVKGSVK